MAGRLPPGRASRVGSMCFSSLHRRSLQTGGSLSTGNLNEEALSAKARVGELSGMIPWCRMASIPLEDQMQVPIEQRCVPRSLMPFISCAHRLSDNLGAVTQRSTLFGRHEECTRRRTENPMDVIPQKILLRKQYRIGSACTWCPEVRDTRGIEGRSRSTALRCSL